MPDIPASSPPSPSLDILDSGPIPGGDVRLSPLNIKEKPKNPTAVALSAGEPGQNFPTVVAAGRGKLADQILDIAFANGIKVREDSALAEMLAGIELDSPIPSEAFLAVAEVLSYVYRANGQPNPFDAILAFPGPEKEEGKDDLD